jgi:uncharacterized membrane protein YcfT
LAGVGAASVESQVGTGRMPMARPEAQAPVKQNRYTPEEVAALAAFVATLGTGEAMDGEGFLHTVVSFAKPFRIPDFFLLSGLFVGRVIDRDWRLFADRRVVHFAYFYGLWVVVQSLAKYPAIVGEAGPGAFAAHLVHALIEPYATLWFIYLLAVFSVVTKLLRRVPAAVLLAGAALLQVVPIATPSYLAEEFCARYVYFVAGYLFAGRIFALADRVARHPGAACAGLRSAAGRSKNQRAAWAMPWLPSP